MVQATKEVLQTHGYERTTTTIIAERAGVSVGSVYQYFPGKEALAGEVLDEAMDADVVAFQAAIAELRHLPLDTMIRAFVLGTFRLHSEQLALYQQLVPQVNTAGRAEEQRETMDTLVDLLYQLLEGYDIRHENRQYTAFFLVHGLIGVFHGALKVNPTLLSDPVAIEMATDWVLRWLVPENGSEA